MMAQEQEFLKGQPQMDELAAFVRRSPAFGWPLEGRELTAWRQVLGHGFEAIGGLAMCAALAALRLDVTGAHRSETRPGSTHSLTRKPKRRRAAALQKVSYSTVTATSPSPIRPSTPSSSLRSAPTL